MQPLQGQGYYLYIISIINACRGMHRLPEIKEITYLTFPGKKTPRTPCVPLKNRRGESQLMDDLIRHLFWTTKPTYTYFKTSWCLSILVGQRPGVPQETKHTVNHVRVVDWLLLLPLHLLQQLLLPPRLLLFLPLPVLLLLCQLDEPLLVFPFSLSLRPPNCHLVSQLLLLSQALALSFQSMLQLQSEVRGGTEGQEFTEEDGALCLHFLCYLIVCLALY